MNDILIALSIIMLIYIGRTITFDAIAASRTYDNGAMSAITGVKDDSTESVR